jgi:hypothetical protein
MSSWLLQRLALQTTLPALQQQLQLQQAPRLA